MEKLRIIQVGVGGFGRTWLRTINECQDVELVAAVDVSESNGAEAKKTVHNETLPVFQSHKEAFANVKADAVLIVTPPHTHIAIALDALEAGLHVLTEKPLSYSYDEAMTLYQKYPAYGKKVMVNQNYRWFPEMQAIKQGLRDGLIGEIAYIDWNFRRLHNAKVGTWHVNSSNFLFTDVSVHHFDLMRYFLEKEPIAVSANGSRSSWSWCEGTLVGQAMFEFPGGITANYFGSLEDTGSLTSWNGDIRIVGSAGAIECKNDIPVLVKKDGSRQDLPLPTSTFESKGYSLREFVRSIRNDTTPVTDITDNLKSFLMVNGVIASAQKKQWITYDFATLTYSK